MFMYVQKAFVIPENGTELLEGWVKRMEKRSYVDISNGTYA